MKDTLPAKDYQERFRSQIGSYGVNAVHRNAARHLDPQKGEAILDIGCGEGELAALLAESGAKVTGADYVQEAVDAARHHAPRAAFVKGDMRALPFSNESFDKTVALGVVGYIGEQELAAAFKEVRRILRPGGMFVFRTSPPLSVIGHWVLTFLRPGYRSHAARHSRRLLTKALRQGGFNNLQTWLSLDRGAIRSWRDILLWLAYPFFAQRWFSCIKV